MTNVDLHSEEGREYIRAFFASSDQPPDATEQPAPDLTAGNHVPGEGNNPTTAEDSNDLGVVARALFDPTNH